MAITVGAIQWKGDPICPTVGPPRLCAHVSIYSRLETLPLWCNQMGLFHLEGLSVLPTVLSARLRHHKQLQLTAFQCVQGGFQHIVPVIQHLYEYVTRQAAGRTRF
eukprot:TRINITY_DN30009_c0_g1_i1.p2 TRINITY_DN30009_c0_g1~~TRINITY_DN30009_c0_g1_i1.p2  ORF type:complete len:106 (+),score=1.30 TRINITY_DN30009_c0_g1_i1:331-648(+)